MSLENISSQIYWVVMAVLLVNIMQKKHMKTARAKRTATLMIASLVLLFNLFLAIIIHYQLPAWTAVPSLFITLYAGYLLRGRIAIFSLRCSSCGNKLEYKDILYHDDNRCAACRAADEPADAGEEEQTAAVLTPEQATDVSEIDWDLWEAREKAVICYIIRDGQVLLINKKQGLGSGLVNAPGGRIEEDETASEAAVRETTEETGLTPGDVTQVGTLSFQFKDGYSLKGYVFFADSFTGTMTETDEADPFWVPVGSIPYDKMWEDDALWLPKTLAGSYIEGRFIFDDRKMVSSQVIER